MSIDGTERPGAAERAQEAGAAATGRGGRMSRRRKRNAVLTRAEIAKPIPAVRNRF
jgi:hypothetical protein